MSSISVSEFVTPDGVVEAPGGEPGHPHSSWVFGLMITRLRQQGQGIILVAGSRTPVHMLMRYNLIDE